MDNRHLKVVFAAVILLTSPVWSQAEIHKAIPLWPKGAPGSLGTNDSDIPTITPYLPQPTNASGAAMVICPGGAYVGLAAHEGHDYALFLTQHGISCFVLKYRLGSNGYRHPAMLNDATRAMRWVRANADQYKIDTHRVGIMGSSAGGHLASTVMTHWDAGDKEAADVIEQQNSRPDVGILCYAVITMGKFTSELTREQLLGERSPGKLVEELSNELQVTTSTPPCFLWTVFADKGVPIENTLQFAAALQANNVPFELHLYEKGAHGIGLNDKPPFAHPHQWAGDLLIWLKIRYFLEMKINHHSHMANYVGAAKAAKYLGKQTDS